MAPSPYYHFLTYESKKLLLTSCLYLKLSAFPSKILTYGWFKWSNTQHIVKLGLHVWLKLGWSGDADAKCKRMNYCQPQHSRAQTSPLCLLSLRSYFYCNYWNFCNNQVTFCNNMWQFIETDDIISSSIVPFMLNSILPVLRTWTIFGVSIVVVRPW